MDSLTIRLASLFRSTASSYPPSVQLPPERSGLQLVPVGAQLGEVRERFRRRAHRRVVPGVRIDAGQLVFVDRDQMPSVKPSVRTIATRFMKVGFVRPSSKSLR